jgi:hypothetical protein
MNTIQTILAALATGAAETAGGDADPALARAYADLKSLVLRQFGDNARAARALEDYAEDAETYERPLAKALIEAKADQNEAILAAARSLLQMEAPRAFDVVREIGEREVVRTSDRFTRRAEGVAELKAQAESESRQRMEQYWDAEFKRRAEVAERRAKQQKQERQMLIGVAIVAAAILVTFIAIMIITSAR